LRATESGAVRTTGATAEPVRATRGRTAGTTLSRSTLSKTLAARTAGRRATGARTETLATGAASTRPALTATLGTTEALAAGTTHFGHMERLANLLDLIVAKPQLLANFGPEQKHRSAHLLALHSAHWRRSALGAARKSALLSTRATLRRRDRWLLGNGGDSDDKPGGDGELSN